VSRIRHLEDVRESEHSHRTHRPLRDSGDHCQNVVVENFFLYVQKFGTENYFFRFYFETFPLVYTRLHLCRLSLERDLFLFLFLSLELECLLFGTGDLLLSLDLLRLLSLDLDRVLFLFLVSGDDFLLLVGETLRYEPPLRLVLEFDRDRDRPRGDRDLPRGDRDRRDRDREREGEFLRRSRDLVRRFSLSFVSFVVAVVAFSSSFMTFFSVGGIFQINMIF